MEEVVIVLKECYKYSYSDFTFLRMGLYNINDLINKKRCKKSNIWKTIYYKRIKNTDYFILYIPIMTFMKTTSILEYLQRRNRTEYYYDLKNYIENNHSYYLTLSNIIDI